MKVEQTIPKGNQTMINNPPTFWFPSDKQRERER